jgi:hypothetical protein
MLDMRRTFAVIAVLVLGGAVVVAVLLPSHYSCGQGAVLVRNYGEPPWMCNRVPSVFIPAFPRVDHRLVLRAAIAAAGIVAAAFIVIGSRRRQAAVSEIAGPLDQPQVQR